MKTHEGTCKLVVHKFTGIDMFTVCSLQYCMYTSLQGLICLLSVHFNNACTQVYRDWYVY